MRSRPLIVVALLAGASLLMAGCESVRDAAGGGKDAPDEFAVVTKAPLVIPPDFNLHPPAAGAAPTNQIAPTQAAQNALFAADPATVASTLPGTMTPGERYFLAAAGVQNTDPSIRQQLAADASGMRGADDSFANNVLFWQPSSAAPGGTPVDADAEAHRIDAGRVNGSTAAPAPAPRAPAPAPSGDGSKSDDSGWLGDLWPF